MVHEPSAVLGCMSSVRIVLVILFAATDSVVAGRIVETRIYTEAVALEDQRTQEIRVYDLTICTLAFVAVTDKCEFTSLISNPTY